MATGDGSTELLARLRAVSEQAEVYTVESESTLVSFEANAIKSVEVEETQGTALRAIVDGRLGFTAASGSAHPEEMVASLLASARYGDPAPFRFPAAGPAVDVTTYDPALVDAPIDRLVEIGREIVERLRAVDPEAQVSVDIERGVSRSAVRNSAGADTAEHSSDFSVSIGVERVRGNDVLVLGDSASDIRLSDAYEEALGRVEQQLRQAQRITTLRSGRMPVLFSPAGAMVLALPLTLGLNGENVQRGTSPLSRRVGEAIVDPRISLWDDATLAGRPASSRYDDEGVPCRRQALIESGVSRGFLYDLRTAALMGVESTGNGARGLFTLPSPSPSNLVMAGGDTPLQTMIAGITRGLLVEDVLGLGQGNPLSGAFSNAVGVAYVIRRGEIVGRVKDVTIAGNVYEDLREVAAISRERYWVWDEIQMPYILLPALNVISR